MARSAASGEWPRCRGGRVGDHGFVAVWTVALIGAFGALIGLVLEGGRIILQRSDAYGAAAAAARAGAQELDEPAAVGGVVQLDIDAAEAAALGYLTQAFPDAEWTATAQAEGVEIVVTLAGETDLDIFPGSVPFEVVATVELQTRGN